MACSLADPQESTVEMFWRSPVSMPWLLGPNPASAEGVRLMQRRCRQGKRGPDLRKSELLIPPSSPFPVRPISRGNMGLSPLHPAAFVELIGSNAQTSLLTNQRTVEELPIPLGTPRGSCSSLDLPYVRLSFYCTRFSSARSKFSFGALPCKRRSLWCCPQRTVVAILHHVFLRDEGYGLGERGKSRGHWQQQAARQPLGSGRESEYARRRALTTTIDK